jgi:diguanylate cyclase (GGDEF)-like protein
MIDNLNIKKMTSIDELTGVYLRKYIEDKFSIQLLQARQNSGRLSVIMCDIDKFKLINDKYGHRKGDEILKQIGFHLKRSLRETDLVGRYGGEEFVIVLPNTGEDEAEVVSEKIRQAIESSISLNDDEPVTLSLGVATYPDHGLNEEEIIEKADQALYHSKNTGRNRTTLWNSHIGEEKSRFDKLAGILTGNISNDTRNIQAMVDILELLRISKSKEEKIFSVLTTLIDITQATKGAILEIDGTEIKHVYAREKGYDDWQTCELDMELIESYMDRDSGDYFINWSKVAEINSLGGKPNWKSIIIMPLRDGEITKGMIILSVPISIKEFDFSAFNFVDSVSGVVMKIIEKASDE